MTENNEPELTRHRLAEEHFGKLGRHEFEGLKQGLRDHSQGARVWLYQGRVLCGWHTHLACRELGVEPEYVVVEAADDGEALLKALSVELRRRSLSASPGQWWNGTGGCSGCPRRGTPPWPGVPGLTPRSARPRPRPRSSGRRNCPRWR